MTDLLLAVACIAVVAWALYEALEILFPGARR